MVRKTELRGDQHLDLRFGGGINERDEFNISDEECVEGQNFNIDPINRNLKPRKPQDLKGTAPNSGTVTGIMQLIKRNDTESQLVVADNKIYSWDGASAFTDMTPPIFTSGTGGTRMRSSYWSLDDILVITDVDLENPLYRWDGTVANKVTRQPVGVATTDIQTADGATCSGGTATVTVTSHGWATGDLITISGADQASYNGEFQITVPTSDTFTYSMTCSVSPATGTVVATKMVTLKAKYSIVHQNRVWLFNIDADGTLTPHMILASAFEDAGTYDNATRAGDGAFTGDEAFYLLSPDLKAINGVAEFFDIVIFSTVDGRLFKLTGTDSTDYAISEFYSGSNALGEEAITNIGDDIMYFRRGKVIESLRATDTNFDVETDDRSRWVETTARSMVSPLAVYDQTEQKVYFFDENLSGVLVFDKSLFLAAKQDKQGNRLSPWTCYKTQLSNSFKTKAAGQLRIPGNTTGTRTVYWGDNVGRIFDMNGTGTAGDGGTQKISLRRKSRIITDLNILDELMLGRIEYKRLNVVQVELAFSWLDDYHRTKAIINLKADLGFGGIAFWGGDYYWGTSDLYWSNGTLASEQVSTQGWSVPSGGSGFTIEIQISDVDTYTISRIFV